VRTYSNKVYCRQFAVSRTMTSCSSRTERHARHIPHWHLPAFQCAWVHWTRKLAAEQSRSKSRGLFSVDSVVADGVTTQNFRHWSGEASSDRLLGSAKPGHTEPSDWSAAFYCISNENWPKLMCHCQIQCIFAGFDDLHKLDKAYLTALTCKLSISF